MDLELGKRISDARMKCGLTQQEAAATLDIDRGTYSRIENGEYEIRASELGQLAKLFQTSSDSLLFGVPSSKADMPQSETPELKNLLIESLSGYMEVNLTRNEIIGDVFEITDSRKRTTINLTDGDGNRFTYDGFMQWLAENVLISNPQRFLEKSNCSWLISCFRNGKRVIDILCTERDADGKPRELKQTYYLSANQNGEVYAICAVSNVTRSLESIQDSVQYAEIATALSDSFEGVFYVNLLDDSYVSLKTKGIFYAVSRYFSGQNFFEGSLKHLRDAVHREDYAILADFFRKDFLIPKLKDGNVTSMLYRLIRDGQEIYYRTRISNSGCDEHHILFAVENVNESVVNERFRNEKLMRDRHIIEVLSSEYSSIYYVDLVADTFEIYKLENAYVPVFGETQGERPTYSAAYEKCVEKMVYQQDRALMRKAGSLYNILTVLRDRESFTTTYRAQRDNGATYCEMKIVRVGTEELPTAVVIGFADNSEEKNRELEKARNISVVLQLTNNFEAVYDVDIVTGHYRCYSDSEIFSGERFRRVIPHKDIFEGIAQTADRGIFVDDRKLVRTFLTREYLKNALSESRDFQMDFRILLGGVPTWYHLKAVLDESRNGEGLIFGLFNIEEQRKKELVQLSEMKKLTQEAHYDMLTGIRNRNAYIVFENEMNKAMQETKEPFAVAVFDINDLKTINDHFGHERGDLLIQKVSLMICGSCKHSPVFRLGGDEFVAILRGEDYENREAIIGGIRQISEYNVGTEKPVTACGFSDRSESDVCLADVFQRADEEMYQNKAMLKSYACEG